MQSGGKVRESSLAASFYAPFGLHTRGSLAGVVRGMARERAQQMDPHISSVMTNSLFHTPGQPGAGLDLAAQLVQQGRDHALPPYADWRHFCGGQRPRSFQDLEPLMGAEAAAALASVYRNVTDVDLLPGALSERPAPGQSVAGSTHSNLSPPIVDSISIPILKLSSRWFTKLSLLLTFDVE